MAKQGQHNNDAHDYDKSPGPNNPSKSVTITTGSYKKPETYRKEAAEKNTGPQAQDDKNTWNEDTHTRDKPSIESSRRERKPAREKTETADHAQHNEAGRPWEVYPKDWMEDLHPDFMAGTNYDLEGPHPAKDGNIPTAYDIKALHDRLPGYSDDELKRIPVLPAGSRLEQDATYIDLRDSQPREFTATAQIVAGANNWYVPKTEVGYPLWNRLIGVQNPARLDQAG